MTDLVTLSLGAGVQSTALALLAAEGKLPRPDVAIFADTGWEPAAVYDHLDRLAVTLDEVGIRLIRVSNGDLRADLLNPDTRFATVPYFIRNHDGSRGMGRRQCTSEYKLAPINRKVRELLGASPPHFRRVPRGRVAEQWIGFSTDEIHRVSDKDRLLYIVKRYPLLELEMSRRDCIEWLAARQWFPVKSACIGCPYHGDKYWRDMRDHRPVEWDDAVEFDVAIRRGARGGRQDLSLNGEAFLHASRVPLGQAPIDRGAAETEAGDPDGCSPYGCRSGRQG